MASCLQIWPLIIRKEKGESEIGLLLPLTPRAEWKTAMGLYLVFILEYLLINLWHPFIGALMGSHPFRNTEWTMQGQLIQPSPLSSSKLVPLLHAKASTYCHAPPSLVFQPLAMTTGSMALSSPSTGLNPCWAPVSCSSGKILFFYSSEITWWCQTQANNPKPSPFTVPANVCYHGFADSRHDSMGMIFFTSVIKYPDLRGRKVSYGLQIQRWHSPTWLGGWHGSRSMRLVWLITRNRKREKRKWGQVINLQNPPPVVHFFQQDSTS